MSSTKRPHPDRRDGASEGATPSHAPAGKRTLTQGLQCKRTNEQTSSHPPQLKTPSASVDGADDVFSLHLPVQMRSTGSSAQSVHSAAARGVSSESEGGRLPHVDAIQASFGSFDVSGVKAHIGGDAKAACDEIGAAAYATGNSVAFAESPDLHTAAHEAAHVVQQARGVNLYDGVGDAGDAYEEQADEIADRVVAGESAEDLLGESPDAGSPSADDAVQMRGKRNKKSAKPKVAAKPLAASIKVGEKSKHALNVTSANGLSRSKMRWGGGLELGRTTDVLEFIDIVDHGRGRADLIVKGIGAGQGEASGALVYETRDGKEEFLASPTVRVQVGNHLQSAEADLKDIEERRARGEAIGEKEETTAQLEAVAASQEGLAKAKGVSGTEINAIVTKVLGDITIIEEQKQAGYMKAIVDLTAHGLNQPADYGAFGQSLAGNLLWALSGLLALTPQGLAVNGFLRFFAAHKETTGAILSTIAGTAGAMTAQFASLPSSSGPGDAHRLLQDHLVKMNADLCDHMRQRMYLLLVDAAQEVPPPKGIDAQSYAADLQSTVRHLLYGEMWQRGMAKGADLNTGEILAVAHADLLRQYVVPNSRVNHKGDLVAGPDASNPDTVTGAIDILKEKDRLSIEEYAIVAEQAMVAASGLGATIQVDPVTLAKKLATADEVVLPLSPGQPAHGHIHHLFFMDMMEYDPPFIDRFDADLKSDSFAGVTAIRISKEHMNSGKLGPNGKAAYSADTFIFDAKVRRYDKEDADGNAPEQAHRLKYRVDVSHGYKGNIFGGIVVP